MATTTDVGYDQCIYVMRHGARLDAVDLQWERTTERPYDTPITGKGKLEAYKAGKERFAGKGVKNIVSSPFLRCLQTAQEVCNAIGLDGLRTCNGLSEVMSFGAKMTTAPLVPIDNLEDYNVTVLEYDTLPMPQFPETLDQSLARYHTVIQEVADYYYPENLVLVTHQYGVEVALKLGLEKDHPFYYEVVYCGSVELKREMKDRNWKVGSKRGIYKYDQVFE